MPFEKTDGMIRHTRLQNESREYLERREELRRAEVELIRQSEKVAALRRSLPQGTPVQDYVFPRRAGGPGCRRCGAARPLERAVQHADETAADHLSLHVRQEADAAVPDVHDDDRRLQRHRLPPRAERRLRHRRRGGAGGLARARARPWLAAAAPAQRGGQHVQVRPAQRGRRGAPGLGDLGIHARRRRHGPALSTRTTRGSRTTCTSAGRI